MNRYVKVCPACLSPKINSHLGFTGEGYKCLVCGFDNFQPIELLEKNVKA